MARARRASSLTRALLPLAFVALGACRQTVILDPAAGLDGGAGAGAPLVDAADGRDGASGSGGAGGSGGSGGNAGFGGFGGRDGGRSDSGVCFGGPLQPIGFTLRAPDLVLAVDRSAPMQTWFGSGTRLQVIQQAVLELILKYQVAVRFGYAEFPGAGGMCNNGLGCCAGDVTAPTSMSLAAIQHVINDCDNGNGNGCVLGQRPLADALTKIEKAYSYLNVSARSRYAIVLTGGDPTCGGGSATGPDGGNVSSACDAAAKAVTDLSREQEVSTAVVGVGDEAMGSACLDKLALNGGLGSVGKSPVYRLALTPNDLSQALNTLVRTMAEEACHIDVRSPVSDPSRVQLYIGNATVPVDGVDGWSFDPGTTTKLTVHGSWCDKLIQQSRNGIELLSGCPRP
jgi:hypothetical protein